MFAQISEHKGRRREVGNEPADAEINSEMLLFMFQAHLKFRERKAEAIKPGVGVEVGVEVGVGGGGLTASC